MTQPNPYHQPPQHPHAYPPQGYVYPQPYPHGYVYPPPRKPLHHYVTWPALALVAISLTIAETSRIMDYQLVIVMGMVSQVACIAALVVSVRRRHAVTIIVSIVGLLLGILTAGTGYLAMEEYERILNEAGF